MRSLAPFLGILLFSHALVGCTAKVDDDDVSHAASNGNARGPTCEEGATRCEGDSIATCTSGAFGDPVTCDGDSTCRDNTCSAPTAKQLTQATELGSMLEYIKGETAWHSPLDWEKLRTDGRKTIFRGDGSDRAFITALYRAFVAIPQGHQSFYIDGCGALIPSATVSQRGACGRPHPRGIVVTSARATNALALKKGDLVTRVGTVRGAALIPSLAERPMCTASRPSVSSRDAFTASTFTDLLEPAEEVEIESPDGTKRTVTVPDDALSSGAPLSCADPFSRDTSVAVEAEVRADGVGVIRLPSFIDPEQPFPENGTDEALVEYRAQFEAKILAAFEKVKKAPAIVWDIRGNGGGLTDVGLGFASGFPGARTEPLSYCEVRKPNTDPPEFDPFRYATYALTPGGAFAYSGKVAVLTDGLNYSAADYFSLAVKTRTNAILIGAPSAGAYGASSDSKVFDGPPAFSVGVDMNRCSSADDGQPLESQSVTPHVAAEYDPKDLATGKDTVLERAVMLLK